VANHCYIIVADYGPRISGNEQKEIMGSQLARARGLKFKDAKTKSINLRRNSRARVD